MKRRLAAGTAPTRSIPEAVERAKLCEELGYDSVWLSQIGARDATILATAFALGTESIGIGTGVMPIYPRTPAAMAQMAATVDETSGGRFILGLGTSHKIVVEMWHGMELSKPLKTVREYVAAIKAIFSGQSFSGDIYTTAFSFTGYTPLRQPPIYLSCLSPKMCELTGEIADGAVLWMCSPSYIESEVIPNIAKGRERAGKTMEDFEVIAAVPVALTDDLEGARISFGKTASVYWSLPFYRAAIEAGGLADSIAAFDKGGPSAIGLDAVETFAAIGDATRIGAKLDEYISAGVTLPMVGLMGPHDGYLGHEETLSAAVGELVS